MSRKEWFVAVTLSFERFQFACHIDSAVGVVTNIEWYDSDRVAGNEKFIILLVVEHEGEYAAEVFKEVDAFLFVEGENHFAVAACLKFIFPCVLTTNVLMVVYLAVDCKYLFFVGGEERLSATFRIDDT